MRRPLSRLGLGLVVAVLYSSWVVAPLIGGRGPGHDDPSHDVVSGLAAAGQPHAALFNTLDVVAGVLAIVLAVLLHRRRAAPLAGVVALVLFGVGVIVGALAPMDCSPSLSAACAAADERSWHEDVHVLASGPEFGGLVAAMFLCSWPRRRLPLERMWCLAAPLVALVTAYVAIRAIGDHPVGWSERAVLVSFALWLATVDERPP